MLLASLVHRRAAVLMSLVVYGTVAFMGQGLHVLLPEACVTCAAEPDSKHAGCTCSHHAACSDLHGCESKGSEKKPSHDCKNCSVCEFLAQVSAASWAYIPTISLPLVACSVVVHPTPAFSSNESLVHIPRGPPSLAV